MPHSILFPKVLLMQIFRVLGDSTGLVKPVNLLLVSNVNLQWLSELLQRVDQTDETRALTGELLDAIKFGVKKEE